MTSTVPTYHEHVVSITVEPHTNYVAACTCGYLIVIAALSDVVAAGVALEHVKRAQEWCRDAKVRTGRPPRILRGVRRSRRGGAGMTYQEPRDWDGDPHRHNPDVHFRLYVNPSDGKVAVICVQDFDYPDYDARNVLSAEAWGTEHEAEMALAKILPMVNVAAAGLGADIVSAALRARHCVRGFWPLGCESPWG